MDPLENAAPFERLIGSPLREPPRRLPVPRCPILLDPAKGGVDFRPELAGLIAPLVDVESAEAQFIAVGYVLRLARPKAVWTADMSILRGCLSGQTNTLMNFVRGFDPELVAEAEVALLGRAEVLIEKLELVFLRDDVPCERDLALDICRLRSEMEMLEIALRMCGRLKPNIVRRVDALGIGRLPWLRDAIGDSTAEEGDRWSEELIDAPEAWWAEAMLAD